jgi:ubiquinone/menaquinone biosynthesis C-methylase UbiE
MDNQKAYNVWSKNYDTVKNLTRDIEALALRKSLESVELLEILELGCGTGKNTEWLVSRAKHLIGADFSEEMLAKAKEKITANNVEFHQIDLREKWQFSDSKFDLITCSLALEHIENIHFIFQEANRVLRKGGKFYIGELHPFKQYSGTKARFEMENKVFELECFIHNISEYFDVAKSNNFDVIELKEWFDDEDESEIPRLLTMMFEAKK